MMLHGLECSLESLPRPPASCRTSPLPELPTQRFARPQLQPECGYGNLGLVPDKGQATPRPN
jgi:hypothetical protein